MGYPFIRACGASSSLAQEIFSSLCCGTRNREALLSARSIGDHPYRIDRLVGGAGGDEDVLAGQRHFSRSAN
jgi:hypothetical protein